MVFEGVTSGKAVLMWEVTLGRMGGGHGCKERKIAGHGGLQQYSTIGRGPLAGSMPDCVPVDTYRGGRGERRICPGSNPTSRYWRWAP